MMYVRFPLSLRNVEDLLHERETNLAGQRWSGGAVERVEQFPCNLRNASAVQDTVPSFFARRSLLISA
jgi:transposase-like protein